MPVAAIKTEADTWVPTLGRVNEIFGKSMRVLADLQHTERDSGANSQAQITQLNERQKLCEAIFDAFGKFSTSVHGSITIEIPKTHDVPLPKLTEKQRQAIAMIDGWLNGDEDEQTETFEALAKGIDEQRRGYRTLFNR